MKRFCIAMLLSLFCVVLPFEAMAGKGELLTLKMHDSKIYPGTERKITVYVPQEYDGRTPACLWVSMSGPSGLTAEILDRMIGAGETLGEGCRPSNLWQ